MEIRELADDEPIIREIGEDELAPAESPETGIGGQFLAGLNDVTSLLAKPFEALLPTVVYTPGTGFETLSPEETAQRREAGAIGIPGMATEKSQNVLGAAARFAGQTAAAGPILGRAASLVSASAAPAATALGRVAQFPRSVAAAAGQTFARAPVASTAIETGLGAAAGAGGFIAGQIHPDSPAAEVIGELIGGTLPALTPTSLMIRAGGGVRAIVNRVKQPFTTSGGQTRAEERVRRAVPEDRRGQALEELDRPTTIDPGTGAPVLTPSQRTGDPGLLSLERAVVESSEQLLRESDLQIAQANRVIQDAMQGIGAAPSLAAARFADEQRQYLRGLLDTRAKIAAQRADERIAQLGPRAGREEANRIAREELDGALQAAKTQERELYALLPMQAPTPTSQAIEQYRALAAELSSAQRGDMPAVARRLLDRGSDGFLGSETTLLEMRGLQSKLREEARNARAGDRRNLNKARIADDIADAITGDIANMGARKGPAAGKAPTGVPPEARLRASRSWARVNDLPLHDARPEPDEFYYHVTSAPNAEKILREGIEPGKSLMGRGGNAGRSAGQVFVTDAGGVRFWMDRAEEHLFDQFDNPPDVVVVRIPKSEVGPLPVDDAGTLDARATAYVAEARNLNKAQIADDIADAITDDIAHMGADGAEADAVRMAVGFSRDLNDRFSRGSVGKLLGRDVRGGDRVPASLTLEQSIGLSGPRAREAFDDLFRAFDSPEAPSSIALLGAASDYMRGKFLRAAVEQGALNPRKAQAFLAQHEEILGRLPGVRRQIDEVIEAGDLAAITQRQRSRARLDDIRISKAAMLIERGPIETFRSLSKLTEKQAATEAQKLVNLVSKDTTGEALAGLRSGFVEHLMMQAKDRGRDAQGLPFLSGFGMRDALADPATRAMANRVFSADDLNRLGIITRDLIRMERRRGATIPAEGILGDEPSKFINLLASTVGVMVGHRASKRLGVGGNIQLPGAAADRFRDLAKAGIRDPATRLIRDAVQDDALLRDVLQATLEPSTGRLPEPARRRLNAWAANVLAEQGGAYSVGPEEQGGEGAANEPQ